MEKQQIIKLLHNNGLKATLQRQIICEHLLDTNDHPTAEQILKKVRKNYPTIGLATIYATLKSLKDKKIIYELEFSNNTSSHFEPKTHSHINIICPKCHKIVDYESETFDIFWDEIIKEIGRSPEREGIDLYINCVNCSHN